MLKKIILSLLVLSMITLTFAGCFGDKTTETQTSEEVTTSAVANGGVSEEDTFEEYDFDGAEFTILSRTETKYEFDDSKGLGGDTIARAVYKRNYQVEDRFNVDLKLITKIGDWEKRNDFLSVVRGEAMGGTGGYDLVSTHSVYLGWMTVEGLATDMSTLPEMDFSKSWWNQNLYDEVNINGHVYFMLGDICTTTYEYMQVMFVNETKFNDYFNEEGIDTIYELVENNEWTWEKCMAYASAYGTGDSSDTVAYGLAQNVHSWRASFISQDAYLYSRDDNGDLMITVNPSDKLIDIVEKMCAFYALDNVLFHTEWNTGAGRLNPEFCSGNVLFYPQTLGEAATIASSMKDQYGVIPVPKYDVYQEKYYTICRDTVSSVMIMTTTDTPEMAGIVTEALCMYGQKLVTPEYYEIVLKVRYFSDPKYAEILDLIRDGLTIQPVDCYIEGAEDCDMFIEIVKNNRPTEIVSRYTQFSAASQRMLDTFYASLKNQGLY